MRDEHEVSRFYGHLIIHTIRNGGKIKIANIFHLEKRKKFTRCQSTSATERSNYRDIFQARLAESRPLTRGGSRIYLAILNLISLTFGAPRAPRSPQLGRARIYKQGRAACTQSRTRTVPACPCTLVLAGFPQGSTSALGRSERLPREGCRAGHLTPGPATNRGNTTSRESLTSCASHRISALGPAPAPRIPFSFGLLVARPSRPTYVAAIFPETLLSLSLSSRCSSRGEYFERPDRAMITRYARSSNVT